MKRKIVTLIMISILAMATVACGNESSDTTTDADSNKVNVEGVSTENNTESLATEEIADTETAESEEQIESDSHEHSYTEELTKEPTCDESGEMTYTCACGDTYTEETGRMDHCTDRSEITKEATCEEEGVETFYCIFCGREIYTEKIAKLPHTANCNHESGKTETSMDPKDYTYTQYIKLMYVTGTNGLYSWPDENSDPYTYLEIGTAVPVVSKCDQADFYQTPWGMTISGKNLSEERPVEYAPGGEEGWDSFKEESDAKYTYWTGVYRVNGYEVHSDYMNKPYVERHINYAKQGLYTLMYRDVNSEYWSGCYEIMIDKDDYFMSSQYLDWIEAYMKSKGLKVSTAGEEPLLVYRSPKSEDSQKLVVVSICVGK